MNRQMVWHAFTVCFLGILLRFLGLLKLLRCAGIPRVPPSSPPSSQTSPSRRDGRERYIAPADRHAYPGACSRTRPIWF
jgi:hypothetical protein